MTEAAPTKQLFETWNTALERYCAHPSAITYIEQETAWHAYVAALNALAEADKQASIAESWPKDIDQDIFETTSEAIDQGD